MNDVWISWLQNLDYISRVAAFKMMRTVILSTVIMLLLILVRKIIDVYGRRHRKMTGLYLKAYLWVILIPVPFMGSLKLSYEHFHLRNQIYVWLSHWFIGSPLPSKLYLIGMLCCVVILVRRKRKLHKWVKGLSIYDGGVSGFCVKNMKTVQIRTTPLYITPFTIGIRKPVIVLPEYMLQEFERGETERVLAHEYCHIKKGHLYLYGVLEIFRVLWFLNPLVHICIRKVKDDLEMVCDHEAIGKNTYNPESYGMTLIKSMSFMVSGNTHPGSQKGMPAFARGTSFAVMKKRIRCIAGYREYSRAYFRNLHIIFALVVLVVMIAGKICSYPAYTPFEGYSLYNYNGTHAVFMNHAAFDAAIEERDSGLLVNNLKVRELIGQKGLDDQADYWIYYGGYMKFPGVGGGGGLLGYYPSEMKNETVFLPFYEKDTTSSVIEWILKHM